MTQVWEHWEAMVCAARGILGAQDGARDCAAEAMAQYLERHPEDVANLEAFMVTIAKRRAVDLIRRDERSRRREVKVGAQFALDVRDVAEDVVARAEAKWVDQTARKLLKPQVYRLVRMIADGVPLEQAAETLGMTDRAAQSHLLRARRTIREALAKTLAALGLLGAGVRRMLAPANTTATMVAAFLTMLVVVPHVSPPEDATPTLQLLPNTSPQQQASFQTPFSLVARDPAGARAKPVSAQLAKQSRGSRREVVRVQTPVVGIGMEQHDDGQSNGGLPARLVACLQNLRIEPNYQGCEKREDSRAEPLPGPLLP